MWFLLRLFLIFSICCAWAEESSQYKPYIILLYGAKGSGRAVVAVKLKQSFSFPDISLASLISNHILEETSLGQQAREYLLDGRELPTELSLSILSDRILSPDCSKGILFEDFPLTADYYLAMQKDLSSSFNFLVIYINASDDWLVERAEHRFVCRTCGRVYDESTTPLKNKGVCDICLTPLQKRLDDSPEVIRARVANYRAQISPLIDLYKKEKILIEVNGERKFDVVYKDVTNFIEAHTGLHSH